jgi:type II secretory pathway pseudopilin PulG
MNKLNSRRSGQSLVEYVVLLALLAIMAVTVVAGLGQRSQGRVAQANEALEEAAVASHTSPAYAGKPPAGGTAGLPSRR